MSMALARSLPKVLTLTLIASAASAADVSVRFSPADLAGAPFPSNRFTVFDGTQNTLRRVAMPLPDCSVRPSDCSDLRVINQLDGFSTQPRITIPFTGAIDLNTVNSQTIYLVNVGDTLTGAGAGQRVGINQVLWDTATHTLVAESDQLLQQHARYLLVVTDGVRDAQGGKLKSGGWGDEFGLAFGRDAGSADYRRELRSAVQAQRRDTHNIVAASLFTTQSVAADLTKISASIKQSTPSPIDFRIGQADGASASSVFPVANLQSITIRRQTSTAPGFTNSSAALGALGVVPGAVGSVAYGRFRSTDYQTVDKVIPATGTLSGTPQPQGTNDLIVQVFLPAGPAPAGGWPVALFGHGFTDSMYGAPWAVASVMASQRIATVSLNVVGHGGGSLGSLLVQNNGSTLVTVPAGGRGIDQDGNAAIDSTEGVNAAPSVSAVGSRDGLRQTVIDYMQLVRQIEAGVDVDGDGARDLNPQRIYYAGQSFGGIYGTILTGVEPSLKAAVLNVPGGSITEVARLGGFRLLTAGALASRTPQLLNLPPAPGVPFPFNLRFDENIPLRDLPPVVNGVPGATAIAEVLDRLEWVQQSGNPVSYASFIRQQPLPGQMPKPVIVQFAKGDATVPNPTSSAILRAGALSDRATYFRNDLAYAVNAAVGKNPHVFLTNLNNPAAAGYALQAQGQMAGFFASNGAMTVDPDGAGVFFETPIAGPLPETLNFIP